MRCNPGHFHHHARVLGTSVAFEHGVEHPPRGQRRAQAEAGPCARPSLARSQDGSAVLIHNTGQLIMNMPTMRTLDPRYTLCYNGDRNGCYTSSPVRTRAEHRATVGSCGNVRD
jgi:hypothetical protein